MSLRLRWSGSALEVDESYASDPGLLETLSGALLHLWRFRTFSDSRWMTIGETCRALAAALLTGVDDLIAAVRAMPNVSDHFIGGFSRLTEPIRQFACVAVVASYVSDGFLSELLGDDRVARSRYFGVFVPCLIEIVEYPLLICWLSGGLLVRGFAAWRARPAGTAPLCVCGCRGTLIVLCGLGCLTLVRFVARGAAGHPKTNRGVCVIS